MKKKMEGGGGDALLNLAVELYDLLQRKDTSMGDLLQTMESKKGMEKRTEEQSDEVVSMQGDADEMFRNLIRGIRKVGSGGTISVAGDLQDRDGGDGEVEELRARLSNVTVREKERVEGLQAQLEMMRLELRECRKQRSMDQSIIAAADSQTSQLKASLRMTQEDAESLRGTLEQELARGHALQGRVNQLEAEMRAAKARAKTDQEEIARLQALVDQGQRQLLEAPPLKVTTQRPSSAGRARGGQEAAVAAVAVAVAVAPEAPHPPLDPPEPPRPGPGPGAALADGPGPGPGPGPAGQGRSLASFGRPASASPPWTSTAWWSATTFSRSRCRVPSWA
mmetsp:Transcript_32963/g.84475  ORF Transcript_32963/g.84475 Transcript_32963/m.84475 type:complete len:337 (-) Transcript_32963:206-1216(-)